MMPPPYNLRPNKAVDRLTLIEAIKRVVPADELRQYTYYGMGGPYLEDFRLVYELYPEIKMVCIEKNEDIHKRQKFHLPCRSRRLRLEKTPLSSFLAEYDPDGERSIFWLDYTDLKFANFDDFMDLLGKVGEKSIIKITLRCNPPDYQSPIPEKQLEREEEFKRRFDAVLPGSFQTVPIKRRDFAILIQEMLQIASQKALPGTTPRMFLPISSFFYSDGTGIFTLTGVVCPRIDEANFRKLFKTWDFANLNWNVPLEINVPNLSTKERLHLQRRLPCHKNAGRILRRSLGYMIDKNRARTETQLQQYADFHRYFPYFVRATP